MAKEKKIRRGTTAEHSIFTGAVGEITVDTTKDTLVIHDGTTVGGFVLAREDMSNVSDIAHSKLATMTSGQLLIGNVSNIPTSTTVSGDVVINGAGVTAISTGVIVDSDINSDAEIAVSKLADGAARQLLQTDAGGTGVEWTSNVDVPGTLDVTSTATFDSISQHPLGSATDPTITFTGDNNTGLYSSGADEVAITTGGSRRVMISSSGISVTGDMTGTSTLGLYSTTTGAVTLDSGTTGDINIGTGANAKTITVGNSSVAGSVQVNSNTTFASGRTVTLSGVTSGTIALRASSIAGTNTITFPANTGTVSLTNDKLSSFASTTSAELAGVISDETGTGALVFANTPTLVTPVLGSATGTSLSLTGGSFTTRPAATQDGVIISGRAGGTGTYDVTITPTTLTDDRTLTLPDVTGTVVTTGDTGTVTSTMIVDGTIVNGDISASAAIVDTKLATISTAGKVSNSATTATNLNTASAIVARDANGDFSAGIITHAAGTAATPSLTFTGDTNTGIYSPGADQVAVSTGGTGRLFVDANGNVGIGTASPGAALEVNRSVAATSSPNYFDAIRLRNGLDGGARIIASNSVTNILSSIELGVTSSGGGTDDGVIVFSTALNNSLSERLRIDSSGNVGIGTSSPGSLLACYRASSATVTIGTENHALQARADDALGGVGINSVTGSAILFSQANTERLRIDSSGRLLVGTSSDPSIATYGQNLVINTSRQANGIGNLGLYGADISPIMYLARGNSLVSNGNELGVIQFGGHDGTGLNSFSASISASVDGTPGTNDMPGRLVFSTTADGASSPTERMRITSDGTTLFGGITAVPNGTNIGMAWRTSGDRALVIGGSSTGGDAQIEFVNPNGTVGSISTTGTATAYSTSSDYRLKENVVAVTDGIARLRQLKPSRFNFIADPTKTVDGFIAHEVQSVVPEAITGEKDAVDDDGNPVYQGIDQSKMVPLVVAALQECIKKVEELEAEVASLKAKV